ncbi:ATP-dependent RNA helicase dbp10 [Tilletia horrida]|uniref:RNA helicase n=1 Tax=Tilletia horrida TaxID=155126 RepID=A0AAN6GGJ1_9BASI|nr:ATP-dependent RNA helicase dbp10 [Tilletia horrida]
MARALDFLASDDEDAGAFAGAPARGGRGTGGSGSRSHGRRQHDHGNDDGADDDGEDGEDDSAFIAAAQIAQNKKAAAQVVKDSIAKGKGKKGSKAAAGGLTGGGSFQSMGLHPSLVRSLLLRGFANPTPIQRLAIPAILEHPPRDVVGMARTGSGKTLAYTVPLIQHLNGRHSSTFGIKALILCPSRELALQILRVGKDIARGWKGGADAEGTDDPAAAQRSEAIRWALIVGGEGMDEQFALMANNPDIVIATPGRLLHLAVEMNLDFSSVSYVVFDEADRLFEMGFAEQLTELLHRLPVHRQTLLFSATLPKSLVEFARAGLSENPKLVRLDADSKVSAELRMAFFSIKPSEKDAALLILLKDLIGVPFGAQKAPDAALEEALNDESDDDNAGGASGGRGGAKKGKGHGAAAGGGKGRGKGKRTRSANAGAISGADQLRPHQTIIFCATKHHVEYLLLLLSTAGYACSHIYSSLDQAARSLQMARFRRGETSLLIVTDVAARGIDLPVLEHVINYDFPTQPRVFVHRVGRTARAGRKGWAWSMVTNAELAFLLDLQLFLARPLIPSPSASDILSKKGSSGDAAEIESLDCAGSLILGTLSREALDQHNEYIASGIMNADSSVAVALPALQAVVKRAQGMYERSQGKASQESYRRAKEMIKAATDAAAELAQGKAGSKASKALGLGKMETQAWRLAGTPLEEAGVHDVLRRPHVYGLTPLPRGSGSASSSTATTSAAATDAKMAAARAALLAKVSAFSPAETVFEVGIGKNRAASAGSAAAALENAALMRQRRKTLEKKQARAAAHARKDADSDEGEGEEDDEEEKDDDDAGADGAGMDLYDGKEVDMADEEDIQDVFGGGASSKAAAASKKRKRAEADVSSDEDDSDGELALPQKGKFRDPRFYLDYQQKDANTERGYSLSAAAGGSFAEQARLATFGLATDEATLGTQTQRVNAQRWDTKKQKFIRGDGTGSDNKKLIRTESGARLPASFRSGRWEEWKREKRIDMPKVGERELERSAGPSSHGSGGGGGGGGSSGGKTFRHTKMQAPKPLDKLAKDYQSKLKQRQRKEAAASDASEGAGAGPSSSSSPAFAKNSGTGPKRGGPSKRGGKKGSGGARGAGGGRGGKARNELRSAADIQKSRALLAKRKEKNARPSKKKARRK